MLAICRFGPFTLLGLFAGVITDRFDNRRTVIATQSVQMVFSAVLAVLTLVGHVQLWEVYAIAALTGIALVFDAPSRQNLTFQMVGRDELPNAVALNSSLFNTARIFGPALAGILIAAFGAGWCFAINTVSFLAVLGEPARDARQRAVPAGGPRAGPTIWRGTREGFATRARNRTVLGDPRDDGRLLVDLLQLQHPAPAAREAHARGRAADLRRSSRRASAPARCSARSRRRRWRTRAGA